MTQRSARLRCFISAPLNPESKPVRAAIQRGIHLAGARSVSIDRVFIPGESIFQSIQGELAQSDCVIAEISSRNANVFLEIGLSQAMGKPLILCAQRNAERSVATDIAGFEVILYDIDSTGLQSLAQEINRTVSLIKHQPRRARTSAKFELPFSIDWTRLEPAETENLCQELLIQMGYTRVDWATDSKEIDLVAELPKKDPDGFQYKELWLVNMGRNGMPRELFEYARDPEFLFHRLFRTSGGLLGRSALKNFTQSPITVLFILLDGNEDNELAERLQMMLSREVSIKSSRFVGTIRFRMWDRSVVTSLVRQYPQLAYKYFSDEGRAKSKYRKSPEELNRENSQLLKTQAVLISNLTLEKNRRVRAERDAVWKSISFSAAHKIGNPLFAIETDLGPLEKRLSENRPDEAAIVVANIKSAVEKAKAIIDQFKSLTRAQEIKPAAIRLRPLIEDAARLATNAGVICTIECPEDFVILADQERIGECLDELAVNSTHWFDKPEKTLSFDAAVAHTVPAALDSSQSYAVMHVRDNGSGIPLDRKQKIFDAFYTTYTHGTGLGLALVRRIVEGHGGSVSEIGKPGEGAIFEIFLPLPGPSVDGSKTGLLSEIDGSAKSLSPKPIKQKRSAVKRRTSRKKVKKAKRIVKRKL